MKIEVKEIRLLNFQTKDVESYLSQMTKEKVLYDYLTWHYLGAERARTREEWEKENMEFAEQNGQSIYVSYVLLNGKEFGITGSFREVDGKIELLSLNTIHSADAMAFPTVSETTPVEVRTEDKKAEIDKPPLNPEEKTFKSVLNTMMKNDIYIPLKKAGRNWFKVNSQTEYKKLTDVDNGVFVREDTEYISFIGPSPTHTKYLSRSELAIKIIGLNELSRTHYLADVFIKKLEEVKPATVKQYIQQRLEEVDQVKSQFIEILFILNIPYIDDCLLDWDGCPNVYRSEIEKARNAKEEQS